MATIGSTKSIPNPGFNPWTSKVELDTNTGAQIAYVYGGSGKLLYSGTPQEVVSQIPTNTSYNADKAFFDELGGKTGGIAKTFWWYRFKRICNWWHDKLDTELVSYT